MEDGGGGREERWKRTGVRRSKEEGVGRRNVDGIEFLCVSVFLREVSISYQSESRYISVACTAQCGPGLGS